MPHVSLQCMHISSGAPWCASAAKQVLAAAEASGLLPLFKALNLSTDVQSLERAMHWLMLQGADTVADLRELPPGTYTCTKLADGLGVPLIKAQRLLTALEGTRALPSKARRHSVPDSAAHVRLML
jgi:hypothetical protein